jgi:hypothetical protein
MAASNLLQHAPGCERRCGVRSALCDDIAHRFGDVPDSTITRHIEGQPSCVRGPHSTSAQLAIPLARPAGARVTMEDLKISKTFAGFR